MPIFRGSMPGHITDGLGTGGLSCRHLTLQSLQKSISDIVGNGLWLDTFVNHERLLSSVHNHKTVGTFSNVGLEAALHILVAVRVQVIVQFLKKLPTGEQKRLPLSA